MSVDVAYGACLHGLANVARELMARATEVAESFTPPEKVDFMPVLYFIENFRKRIPVSDPREFIRLSNPLEVIRFFPVNNTVLDEALDAARKRTNDGRERYAASLKAESSRQSCGSLHGSGSRSDVGGFKNRSGSEYAHAEYGEEHRS